MNSKATRWLRVCGATALAFFLVSCGGGSQVQKFAPTRVVVFGDESSMLVDVNNDNNGRKYTVNALATDNVALECRNNPIWAQVMATGFGLVFPACNPASDGIISPLSRIYARDGAMAADLKAQIDTFLTTNTFDSTTLVGIWIGANDVLAQYAAYSGIAGQNETQLIANLEAAGAAVAAQVNRVADAGGKVVIVTAPDLGLSPFAIAERASHSDTDRVAVITRLTARFNAKLRATVYNDGRRIGIVTADEILQTAVKFPGVSVPALSDVVTAVCDAYQVTSVFDCTTQTLISNASGGNFLWADATHLSPSGHSMIGRAASTRASSNPF